MRKLIQSTAISIALVVSSVGGAAAANVDTILSLVIDVSGSVSNSEYDLQRGGYVSAFNDATIRGFITDTDNGNREGAIAVNVIQFATNAAEAIPFTVLDSLAAIDTFNSALASMARISGTTLGGDQTDIADGLREATASITGWLGAGNTADATVIDVSGDGPQNEPGSGVGTPSQLADLAAARSAALGVADRINGVAIGDSSLLAFYQNNVIGGTGAFALQASTFATFEDAITRKVEFEVTGTTPVIPLPAPALLLIGGLGALAAVRRGKKAA